MIKLFGTGCEMCRILEERLQEAKIQYIKEKDITEIKKNGFRSVPVIKDEQGKYYNFSESMMKIVRGEWL